MADNRRILVTGASGYIAGHLIPRLLQDGHTLRCMVRKKEKIAGRPWFDQVEVVEAEVTNPDSLPAVLTGITSAYYLIHNMSSGRDYQLAELAGARNFAAVAAAAGVEHIIYLGGLADPADRIGPHMRSRIETGAALRSTPVPVTEFRAGVITGPGSISFEMIRFITEQFPLLIGPTWLNNRSQPISAGNVLDYLTAALDTLACRGQVFEIGGPDTFLYFELMRIYAEVRGLKRPMLLLPGIPASLMAWFVDRLTPVPSAIAYPLINGLRSDSLVKDDRARQVFPHIRLTPYRQAVADALAKLHPGKMVRVWGPEPTDWRLKHEGFLVETRHLRTSASLEEVAGSVRSQHPDYQLVTRQPVLSIQTGEMEWIEWERLSEGLLRQTAFYAPKGLPGFLASWAWRRTLRKTARLILSRSRSRDYSPRSTH
jgi:uncharacterized protein YbjT (DUF2867 family)